MQLLRMGFYGVLLFALCASVFAAEFSPVLEDQLSKVDGKELVSAIVILESPVDIRVLDDQLHAAGGPLAERHQQVIAALKYNAEMTQPAFRAELDQAIESKAVTGYTAYWIENLFVIQATKDFIQSFYMRGDIKYVTENFVAELIEPIIGDANGHEGRDPLDTRFVPPGIRAVGALRVNEELGITGNGVLVANCDTGVDGNHPALAARWRGAGGAEPWQECWRDALGTNTQFPNDGNNHGTHVMGTITGRAVSGVDTTWVGCAPAARWIATNSINQGVSGNFDNDIIADYQWFADPDGNPNTMDDVPDVIQNSWGVFTGLGYPQCFSFWNTVILNCEAVGPVITWSAGNEDFSGLRSPAIYSLNSTQIFSVGAVDASGYPNEPYPIAGFSSRGPTPCVPAIPNTIKPEISAPGVNVYSSVPGGGYNGSYSGTSMAGPHVAGIVALMREACPDCDPTTIKTVIMETANDYAPAGEDNTFGAGFINGYDAVVAVMGNMGRVMGTVRDANTLNPLQAYVEVVGGTQNTTANAAGAYALMLPADSSYTMRYSLYGYVVQEAIVAIVDGDTTIQDIDLVPRPVITLLDEDFETGAPDWTHDSPGGQWIDQWHLSTEQANSGTTSYKCGDISTGTYANFNDARLTSPMVNNLPAESRLKFYMQIESELSGQYPDSAYDGGILEVSANGGAFTQVTPVGGYPKTFRYQSGGSNPATGPMLGQPCWAGTITPWVLREVDLAAFAGQNIQLRFRFGSDQGTGNEGWYVDDVLITALGNFTVEQPTGLTISVVGEDLILRWDADENPAYQIYSDTNSEGAFNTLEGTTNTNEFVIIGGVNADPMKFYHVRGWDGN